MDEQDERDRDTWQRTDYFIDRIGRNPLRAAERRDLVLLLRRYRKRYFGSALTDDERNAGWSEINP